MWQRGVLNWEVEAPNTTLPRLTISQWFVYSLQADIRFRVVIETTIDKS